MRQKGSGQYTKIVQDKYYESQNKKKQTSEKEDINFDPLGNENRYRY